MTERKQITGRYAPSPTGDLHYGNLRTAMLAWLSARLSGGKFLLRMEDLDQPRVMAGSAEQILRDLEWLGLDWDGEVMYQSQRTDAYQEVLELLSSKSLVYPCFCSRKDIQSAMSAPHSKTSAYPGTCRHLSADEIIQKTTHKAPAMRLKVPAMLHAEVGDFVVKRADDLFAYQLAVVVDDLHQGINQVVRGADLLDSCSRQQYLASILAPATAPIEYLHAPLMRDEHGRRLAKRDGSASIRSWCEQGKTAEDLVAYLFNSLGFAERCPALSLNDLRLQLDISHLDSDALSRVWLETH